MNTPLLSTDTFQVEIPTPISNVDIEVLTDLYLPIIGPDGLASYLRLSRIKPGKIYTHNFLFEALSLSSGNFLSARKKLEGIGLLKTKLLSSQDSFQEFLYIVIPPMSGKEFLENPLLKKTLMDSSSNDQVSWGEKIYKNKKHQRKDGEDITSNFSEVFASFEDDALITSTRIGAKGGQIKTNFDVKKFNEYLREVNELINEDFLSRDELSKLEQLTIAYNFKEEASADLLIPCIRWTSPRGKRVDFAKFEQLLKDSQGMSYLKRINEENSKDKLIIPGKSDEAKMLRQMSEKTSEEYLTLMQNGGRLASSDRALIQSLREMYLKDSVINALLDYVSEMQDGTLPPAYVTKIAGSLARKGIDNPIDAYNFLRKKQNKKVTQEETLIVENKEANENKNNEEKSLEELWAEYE